MSSQSHRQTQTETVAPRDHAATDGSARRTRLRDQAVLATLYDRYAPMFYAVAFEQLGSVAASEAVVLDVFVQLQADRSALTLDEPVGAQLCQLAAQHLEAQTVKTVLPQGLPLAKQSNAARGSQVLRAFGQLTEPQQQVLGLALYQGLTLTAVAAQSDLSITTVKTHFRLALRRLRALLSAGE